MNGAEGLVYLLNQSGLALAQANALIAELRAENEGLREAHSNSAQYGTPDSTSTV